MRQSILSRSVVVSLMVHAGLLGLLLVLSKPPAPMDQPMRVRIVEPPPEVVPAPSPPVPAPPPVPRPAPSVAPKAVPAPPSRSGSSERVPRGERLGGPEGGEVAVTRRPTPAPDLPAAPPAPAPPPPPQVVARPAPEVPPPVAEPRREFRQEQPPEKSGLSLGGPAPATLPPLIARPPAGRVRPSIREQIAGLGSAPITDMGGPAKHTINLNDRQPRFLSYLARLKQRIQNEWMYPEDAQRVGMAGELVVVFTLNPAGTLTYIRLAESSGFPTLDEEALRAVKTAAPFDAFPPQMGDEPLNIIGTFTYYSPLRYRRN